MTLAEIHLSGGERDQDARSMVTPDTAAPTVIDLRDKLLITKRPGRLRDARVAVVGAIEDMTYNVVASLGVEGVHVEVLAPHDTERLGRSRFCRALHCIGPSMPGTVSTAAIDVLGDVVRSNEIH